VTSAAAAGSGVCVVGSFMMDLAVRAPRRPEPGETIIGSSFDMFLGGKGFNQAVAAARSGAATAMVGRLGDDDFGRRFRACMAGEGIDDRHVLVDADEGTGIGLPLVEDSGENSIVVVARANQRLSSDDVLAAQATIADAAVLLLQMEVPLYALVAAATVAQRAGTTVVLNPAPAVDSIEPFRGLVDVLVPNLGEARRLLGGVNGVDGTDPLAAAADLRERTGAATVVVTLGDRGALVLDADGPDHQPAHAVPVVDTVGAGDAFCGALGAGLAGGASVRAAATYANAAAALAVTRAGAEPSLPTRAAVLDRFPESATPLAEPARAHP
jgi:ribokinase